MQVCVYKNLRNGRWSVTQATASGGRGKLIGHWDHVILRDVRFVVRESRRQAVVAKHCREVHAWAVGTQAVCMLDPQGAGLEVTYNPYRSALFHTRDGAPVETASEVVFTDRARITRR